MFIAASMISSDGIVNQHHLRPLLTVNGQDHKHTVDDQQSQCKVPISSKQIIRANDNTACQLRWHESCCRPVYLCTEHCACDCTRGHHCVGERFFPLTLRQSSINYHNKGHVSCIKDCLYPINTVNHCQCCMTERDWLNQNHSKSGRGGLCYHESCCHSCKENDYKRKEKNKLDVDKQKIKDEKVMDDLVSQVRLVTVE